MAKLGASTVTINDGDILLYKRARSFAWQAKFKIGSRWVRTTTSRDSAEWIADKFAGSRVSKLNTGLDWEVGRIGRPKAVRAMTSAERVAKHRAAKAAMRDAA